MWSQKHCINVLHKYYNDIQYLNFNEASYCVRRPNFSAYSKTVIELY